MVLKSKFDLCVNKIKENNIKVNIPTNKPYSSLEITKYFPTIEKKAIKEVKKKKYQKIIEIIWKWKRDTL